MEENWKPVVGFEGFYEVSNCGNVRRNGKLLKPHKSKSGYLRIGFRKFGEVVYEEIHRTVLKAFVQPPSPDHHVNHLDRNRENNSLTNLEWCTPAQNVRHSIRMIYGAFPKPKPPKCPPKYVKGEAHYAHKLDTQDIHSIRELRAAGFSQQCIADEFHVSQATISKILLGQKWKHVAHTQAAPATDHCNRVPPPVG